MKDFDCKQCAVGARQSKALTGFFSRFRRHGKERTEAASVTGRRIEAARFPTPGSTWSYLVTFTLVGGSIVELYTTESAYQQLTDGQEGILTWEGENFLRFDTKED